MLYDIAPPILFFSSLGGIIFLVSRVFARLKRRELSAAIQAEGKRDIESPHDFLNPEESRVTLMKSRLAATAGNVRQSLASLKRLPAQLRERRAERISASGESPVRLAPHRREASDAGVRAPRSTWRQQLGTAAENVGQRLNRFQSTLKERLSAWKPGKATSRAASSAGPFAETPAQTKSKISLRRVDTPTPDSQPPRTETTAERLQAFARIRRATTTPVQQAESALAEGNVDRAEDILIPYIAKHPRNAAAYMVLGEAALKKQSWEEAMESYEQVIQLDEATPHAYARLGEAALHAGRVTRALESLQRAHDADPQDVLVLKLLLNIAQRTDNRVLQKSVIQKLMVLSPDDPEVHLAAEALEARESEREQTPTA